MPARPTSVRLTAPQAAEVAALALDLTRARPDLAALSPLTEGAVLRLALARGLAELRADLDRPAAPPPSTAPAPASTAPAAALAEVQLDARGTSYRVTVWRSPGGSLGAAWPDARWSVGDLSPHAPPGVEWLREQGIRAGDAPGLAAAIARAWPRVAR